ncbi:MAG: type II toxin-antitoxin system RelE/ParE family toxin [Nanoarchaeota archaeon]
MYFVEISQNAQRFLDKLDAHIKERIEDALRRLENNPVPSDSKFIGRDNDGEKIFRYRIGDFRVLYLVNEEDKIVLIAKVDRRSKVYK